MSTRALPAVALAVLVVASGVGPVLGVSSTPERAGESTHRVAAPVEPTQNASAQYKVSFKNVTVKTWIVRNSTVVNATITSVVVRNATTANGTRSNVTLSNVTVGRFALERARLSNVTAEKLVVRNKSVLDVPGGSFIDPNIENRTLDRHSTKNQTVSGVVIDRIVVDAAVLCENATLGERAAGNGSVDPTAGEKKPDITVQNGTVGEALVVRGTVSNWSVGSVERPAPTNASLPDSCSPE